MSFSSYESSGQKRGVCPSTLPSSCGAYLGLVCVTEPLDQGGAERLEEKVQRLSQNCRCVVLDLSAAEFLDSDGVRTLLRLDRQLQSARRELRLVLQPGSAVDRIFRLLHLDQCFRAFHSIEEARADRHPSA